MNSPCKMKKLILTKSATVIQKPVDNSSKTYLQRKSMQGSYQELFQALWRLPDKIVQARVLDAINNTEKHTSYIEVIEVCNTCKQKTPKKVFVDASTQTEGNIIMQNLSTTNSDESQDVPTTTTTIEKAISTASTPIDGTRPKRKRKLKTKLPQVIKKSHAQQQMQSNMPFLKKRKTKEAENNDTKQQIPLQSDGKRQRSDSMSSLSSNHSLLLSEPLFKELIADVEQITKDDIKTTMADEFIKSGCTQADGLLPIQSAIVNSDCNYLNRQIFVWKNLKNTDLNEILTDDDEDCLQLAIMEKSSAQIVSILLSKGLDPNTQDAQFNTIIHLAITNDVAAEVLYLLVEKTDIKTLSTLNYDGYTPLHLALRQNNFILAEVLLNGVDKRLMGKIHYDREAIKDEKHFLKYYENCCDQKALEDYLNKYSIQNLRTKRKLMDAGEMCSGNTALFYAIENKLTHFIYFLLAHFTDPTVVNLSGQDATTYLNEFAKSLNLTLKIDQIMERIVNLLENKN